MHRSLDTLRDLGPAPVQEPVGRGKILFLGILVETRVCAVFRAKVGAEERVHLGRIVQRNVVLLVGGALLHGALLQVAARLRLERGEVRTPADQVQLDIGLQREEDERVEGRKGARKRGVLDVVPETQLGLAALVFGQRRGGRRRRRLWEARLF